MSKKCYAVIGRIPDDDEDSFMGYDEPGPVSREQLADWFDQDMLECVHGDNWKKKRDEVAALHHGDRDGRACYITRILVSDSPITEL